MGSVMTRTHDRYTQKIYFSFFFMGEGTGVMGYQTYILHNFEKYILEMFVGGWVTGKGQVQKKSIEMFRWWWLLVPIPVGITHKENVIKVYVKIPLQYVLRGLDYISSVVRSSVVKADPEVKPKAEPEPDVAHTD